MSVQKLDSPDVKKVRYEELLLSAIDECLDSTLGEKSRKLVFLYLRNVFFLEKERICDEPEIFHLCLKSLFGLSASFLEQDILNRLCSKMNLKYFSKEAFSVSLKKIRDYCRFLEEAQF